MSNKVLHAIDIKTVVSESVVGIVLGALLTFVPVSSLVSLVIVIIGLLMIATNGYRLYTKMHTNDKTSNDMIFDAIGALLGVLLLCSGNMVVTIIVATYLVILPIVNMAIVKFNKESLTRELPKLVLGIILLVSGISTFDIIFKILGIIVLIASLGYLLINYYFYKKSGVKIIK